MFPFCIQFIRKSQVCISKRQERIQINTVTSVLSETISIQVTWKSLSSGGCLLLNESSAESFCTNFMQQ